MPGSPPPGSFSDSPHRAEGGLWALQRYSESADATDEGSVRFRFFGTPIGLVAYQEVRVILDQIPSRDRRLTEPVAPGRPLARLRLVCLVRSGDGYLLRATGRLHQDDPDTLDPADGVVSAALSNVDLAFHEGIRWGRSGEFVAAVRQIQRWCEDGTAVDLVDAEPDLLLRSVDGIVVTLPQAG